MYVKFLTDQWVPQVVDASTGWCDLPMSMSTAIIVLTMLTIIIIIGYHTVASATQQIFNHNACYFNINNRIRGAF